MRQVRPRVKSYFCVMKLSELKAGQKAVIQRVDGTGQFRKRILEMGFVQGKEVTVVQGAPLKDPIYYRILDYNVSLRLEDGAKIEVRLLPEEGLQAASADTSEESILQPREPEQELGNMLPLRSRQHGKGNNKHLRIALVGNPNCGKTSLFNQASGAHEHVGNYSGVTIEAKTGYIYYRDYRIEIIDLPGAYSLSAYSPEELYIRDFLLGEKRPDLVLNVLDTCNLERNLYLTLQVKELGLPIVAALNMFDEFATRGERLNYPKLARLLGVPMIPTVCRTGLGLQALFDEIIEVWEGMLEGREEVISPEIGKIRPIQVNYGSLLEPVIEELSTKIDQHLPFEADRPPTRYIASRLVEGDKPLEDQLMNRYPKAAFIISARDYALRTIKDELASHDAEELMTDARYGFISGALRETYQANKQHRESLTDKIDHIVAHRLWGFPIFLLLMYVMFQATFSLGQYPMDWIEAGVGMLGDFIASSMQEGPLRDLLVDGIIAGVGGVIVFLPNILILYFFISIFEDTGYMARSAFIMDKIMHRMGLHGKSFIPLIMGFGCNVPAIMSTRTIESRKSRMITMLVVPFMSCSARLPVYLLLSGALFPDRAALVLFVLYLSGILIAVLSARLLKSTYFKGEDVPFVMELPPYRLPTAQSVVRHMWARAKQYLHKMGTVILVASIVIWFLGYFPRQSEQEQQLADQIERLEQNPNLNEEERNSQRIELEHAFAQYHQENSWIGRIGHASEPLIRPLGFDWKMGVSLISGLAAKEVVVSTLGVIYTGDPDDSEEAQHQLSERIRQEKRPDGSPSFTPLVAMGFMLFVLIYFPCVATIIAIARESGSWRWGAFSVIYSCALAWFVAFAVHQIGLLLVV